MSTLPGGKYITDKLKYNESKRMSSNERTSGPVKVSIDISGTNRGSFGMKNAMKTMQNKGKLTSRYGNRSFNMGNNMSDRLQESSPHASNEHKNEYSTNESDVRLAELVEQENEDKIKILEQKLDKVIREKTEFHKKIQKLEFEHSEVEKERNKLKDENIELEDKLHSYIQQISKGDENASLAVMKQEIQAKSSEIDNLKKEKNEALDTLRVELFKEKDIAREIGNNLEQKEIKIQHCETKIKNLEKTLVQKTKELESSKIGSKFATNDNSDFENELSKLRKELSLYEIKFKRAEDQQISMRKELADKSQLISDQDQLIKDLKNQIGENKEVWDTKLKQKESEVKMMQRDIDFLNEKHNNEISGLKRQLKNKDIEIERMQDKVQMLEIKGQK